LRVLVTGATGFTGGHLARALAQRGDQVRALVRHPGSDPSVSTPGHGIEAVQGDLRDAASLKRAATGVEVIYHIAAIYRQAGLRDTDYRAVNAAAVRTIVEAAAAAGVRRVVHCSTVGVHGDVEHPPANEDAPLKPGDIYQVTKLEGERIGRAAAEDTGLELVIARPTGIYGPGDRRLLKLFRGVSRGRFPILGNGRIFYHLTYIDDLVDGFHLCGTARDAAGRTYILAGGEVTTLNALVQIVAEEAHVKPPRLHLPVWPFWIAGALCEAVCAPLGIEPPIYRRRVDFFTKSRAFDISRARAELGYVPKVGLHEGIARTLAWYRDNRWI
jgi:nucleoside-diphosphate-sugar epimerase